MGLTGGVPPADAKSTPPRRSRPCGASAGTDRVADPLGRLLPARTLDFPTGDRRPCNRTRHPAIEEGVIHAEPGGHGPGPGEQWVRELSPQTVTIGRSPSLGPWCIPWDPQISRLSVELTWRGDELLVRKVDGATNRILFDGQPCDELTVAVGDRFVIGKTTFELREESLTIAGNPPEPAEEFAVSRQQLREIPYDDADRRLEAIASLPAEIRRARGDAELEAKVVDVLLRGSRTRRRPPLSASRDRGRAPSRRSRSARRRPDRWARRVPGRAAT